MGNSNAGWQDSLKHCRDADSATKSTKISDTITLFSPDKGWIEGAAINQLEETSKLAGITHAVGHPDLHPGKGIPVGATFLSEQVVYPHLIGNDIGCGMGLWGTDIPAHKFKLDKIIKKLKGFEEPYDGPVEEIMHAEGFSRDEPHLALGTIGGGNHFAEFQVLENVFDTKAFDALGLNRQSIHLLVHSGSRGLGDSILRAHTDTHGAKGLSFPTQECQGYLEKHDRAARWAKLNRALIARRFFEAIHAEGVCHLDICHNSVCQIGEGHFLHRKGAAPADQGPIVIPGSRGALSYLVMPRQETAPSSLWSLAHGSGRKWKRSDAKGRLSGRYRVQDLERTGLGGRVICEDKQLIYEEAPEAYKDIGAIIDYLTDIGLISPIAAFRPIITYKTRRRA